MRIINASYFSEERTEPISYDEPIISQQNKILQVRRFLATSVILLKRKLHSSSSAFYNQSVLWEEKSGSKLWIFDLLFFLEVQEITSPTICDQGMTHWTRFISVGGLVLISSILIDLDLCWVYIVFTICKHTLAISSQLFYLNIELRRYRELRLVTPIEWWYAIVYQVKRCIVIRERVTTSTYYQFLEWISSREGCSLLGDDHVMV